MIGIDIKMPKSCRTCPISHIEEDMNGDYYYDCGPIQQTIYGKQKDNIHKDCPLCADDTPIIKELNDLRHKLIELQKLNSKQARLCNEDSDYFLGKVNSYYVAIKLIDRHIERLKKRETNE